MSVTQKTNWVALAGLVVIVLKFLGVEIAESEVQVAIGAVVALVGVISNAIHRYKKGDVTPLGAYK